MESGAPADFNIQENEAILEGMMNGPSRSSSRKPIEAAQPAAQPVISPPRHRSNRYRIDEHTDIPAHQPSGHETEDIDQLAHEAPNPEIEEQYAKEAEAESDEKPEDKSEEKPVPEEDPTPNEQEKVSLLACADYYRDVRKYHTKKYTNDAKTDWKEVKLLIAQCDERARQDRALKNTRDALTVGTKLLERVVLETLNPRIPERARLDIGPGPHGEESWYDELYVETHIEHRFDDLLLKIHEMYLKGLFQNPLVELAASIGVSMYSFSAARSGMNKVQQQTPEQAPQLAQPAQSVPKTNQPPQPSVPFTTQLPPAQVSVRPPPPSFPVVSSKELEVMVDRASENIEGNPYVHGFAAHMAAQEAATQQHGLGAPRNNPIVNTPAAAPADNQNSKKPRDRRRR